MEFKITTLVENVVYGKSLQAEHGLSLLIETAGYKLLFDTGASDLFIRNARLLRIDLSEVDYLILSHGHCDHTGGVRHFLEANKKASVICKREIFQRKYKNDRENGMQHPDTLDKSRFVFLDDVTEIVPGIYLFPDIEITDTCDTHFEQFYTEVEGRIIPDTFEDELCIAIKTEKDVSVLSACSHRGITNMMRTVQRTFPEIPVQLVIGGFHIREAETDAFAVISRFFDHYPPERLGVCHCTGVEKYALFREQFKDRVFYNYTGRIETI